MYETIKNRIISSFTKNRIVIGVFSIILIYFACSLIGGYLDTRADYQRARESVERIEKQQRESVELNRGIQHAIDRSTELSREAKGRIERSQEYNRQINDRIGQSQSGLSEARSYLKRNAELFDRIERANRERQENYQTSKDAAQPITDIRSGYDNRNCDTRIVR